jgi:PAS domain S-box-containing protein
MSADDRTLEFLKQENEQLRLRVATLQAETRRYKTTLQSIGDAVISVDTQGHIIQMNPVAETLTGWVETEALGLPLATVFRIVNEETGAAVESPVDRALREGAVIGLANHTVLISRDGTETPIADSGAPIRDENGEVTGVVLVFRDQTEERAAQKALLDSEVRFKNVFENSPLGKSMTDVAGGLRVNQAFASLLGYSKDEICSKAWQEITHPDDIQESADVIQALVNGERAQAQWEKRYIHKSGRVVWTDVATALQRDQQGKPLFFITTVSDITERKRIERSLEDARSRLSEAQIAAHLGNWSWDSVNDEVTGSEEFYRLFDVAPEDLARFAQFVERLHPDDRERVQKDVAAALKQDRPYDTDYRVKLSIGGWRDIIARGRVYTDAQGRAVRMVGTCLDITARKRAEAELRNSEERQRATLRSIGDGVISTDATGGITQMNFVAEALTGWTESEAKGKPVAEVFLIVNEDTRSEVESPADRVLREGVVVGLANHTLLIARNGKECPIADSGAPIHDAQGVITGVVLVFRDQTEERAAQKRLEKSEEKYRTLFDNAEVGMYRSRLDGTGILALNRRLAEIFESTKQEMLAGPATMRWADSRARDEMVRLAQESGTLRDHEMDIMTQHGVVRTLLISVKLYPNEGYLEGSAIDITERKRLEKALRKTQSLLNETQRITKLGGWEFDVGTGHVTWTDEVYDIHGLTLDYDPSSPAQDMEFYAPEDKHTIQEAFARAIEKGEPYDLEVQLINAKQERLWVRTIGRVESTDGKVVRVFGNLMDITERKKADKALRESEQRLRRFYESSLLGVIYWNFKGEITEANDKFLDMVGYTRADLDSGQVDWLNMTPPEYRHLDEASVLELRAKGVNSKPFDKEYIRKDGSRVPIAVAGAMLDEERSNGVAFVLDISERKRAEREIESVARFPSENPNPVLRVGHDGRILYANPSSKDLLVEWSCVVGDFLPPNLQNVVARSVAENDNNLVDVTCGNRVFAVLFVPIQGSEYINLYCRDVTERARAEQDVQRLNEELEQRVIERTAQLEASNQELEAFSYSVSHDLRAPLRAIDGFSRILVQDYAPHFDAEGKRVCGIIHDNTVKMSRLIDDLLAFSRLGRAEMKLSQIDMATMANSIYHELTTPESRARIDFQVGTLPLALADTTLMRQVWTNLLSNAIKFSSKRERATIQVSAEHNQGETVYAVTDDGAGFDMQYVQKLFGVFQRLHSTKEFEGTGVGLALVQRVIRRHGGRVWAQGEIDKGATFCFSLQQGVN